MSDLPGLPDLTDAPLTEAIDVWHLPLVSARAETAILNGEERARLDRFRVDTKKLQFCAARGQLRRILARYVDADPKTLRFEYGEHGKPWLPDHRDLEFNLSHSSRAGLLGVTRGTPIGVDVEQEKPGRRFADIGKRFFAAPEHAALLSLPDGARPAAFYRAWVCKEAYLKAWGSGLSYPPNRFTIDYVDATPPRVRATDMPGDRPGASSLRVVRTFDGHAAAVCFTGPARWLRHFSPGDCSEIESG